MFWKQQGTIVKIRILNIFIFLSNEKNATSDIDGLISSCHNIEASSFSIQLTLYTNTTLWKSATILLRVFVNQNKISKNLVYLIQEKYLQSKDKWYYFAQLLNNADSPVYRHRHGFIHSSNIIQHVPLFKIKDSVTGVKSKFLEIVIARNNIAFNIF